MRLNQKQMALRLNITTRTLRRYIESGKVVPEGYEKNHPYYSEKQITEYILKYGKNLEIVWMVRRPLNNVNNRKNTVNQLVLTDDINNVFEANNKNLNLILDLLTAYKIKNLTIDAAIVDRYPREIKMLNLISKRFGIAIKEELFINETRLEKQKISNRK